MMDQSCFFVFFFNLILILIIYLCENNTSLFWEVDFTFLSLLDLHHSHLD